MDEPIDYAEVMRCHNQHGAAGCFFSAHRYGGKCEPYRLAVEIERLTGELNGMTTARDVWEANARWGRQEQEKLKRMTKEQIDTARGLW